MKKKSFQDRLTFMMIPSANRPIIHVKVAQYIVYALLITIMTAVFSLVIWILFLKIAAFRETSEFNSQLSLQQHQFDTAIAQKQQTIESLQNQIIQLSQQADEVKAKLKEIEDLEKQIEQYTSLAKPPSPQSVKISSAGGEQIPATQEQMNQLYAKTEVNFKEFKDKLTVLNQDLQHVSSVIQAQLEKERTTPSIWPTISHLITSNYGVRSDPFTHKPSFHNGVDIGGHFNDPVFAAADGVIESASSSTLDGNNIVIRHSAELETQYMHLNKILVHVGETVKKGDTIGLLGTTGRSTGPHVHYEVHVNGKRVNPNLYLPATP